MKNDSEKLTAAQEQGLKWLLAQQDRDGAWRSRTYGGLKGGAGITALVTATLAEFNERNDVRRSVSQAGEFLKRGLALRGTLAGIDGTLDYPTYACSLVLTAMNRLPMTAEAIDRKKLLSYLLSAQVTAKRGFEESSPDFGGWDLLGADDARGITTGTNISMTSHVLEAFAGERGDEFTTARQHAETWLERCRAATGDGGFAFTPEAASLNNKALWSDEAREHPRSYGTAVCDGLCALSALGQGSDSPAVKAAVAWLLKHDAVDFPPGFEKAPANLGWREGLRFYYWYRGATILSFFPPEYRYARIERMLAAFLPLQEEAGCWRNSSSRMREDDPLIATCFALKAAARCEHHLAHRGLP